MVLHAETSEIARPSTSGFMQVDTVEGQAKTAGWNHQSIHIRCSGVFFFSERYAVLNVCWLRTRKKQSHLALAVGSGVHRSITVPVTLDRLRFGNTKAGSESLLAQIEERQENHICRLLLSLPLCFFVISVAITL